MQAVSYAKINLFLEVRGVLPDGYHEVDTQLVSIDLFDDIKYTLTKTRDVKTWCNLPELNTDKNLMTRIAGFMRQKYQPAQGVQMLLDKRIPVSAGLGGGSSNAANVIMSLNILWDLKLSASEMHSLAASHGSDVNFFLEGGCCHGKGRGELIFPSEDVVIDHVLLVNPGIPISSREAYELTSINHSVRTFDHTKPLESCFNRLEEGIRDRYPVIDSIITTMKEHGAQVAMMSGSGSTCFGIFDSDSALHKCLAEFPAPHYWTHRTRTLTRDEYQQCFPSLN